VPLEGAVVIAKLFAVTLDENLAAPVALNVPLTSSLSCKFRYLCYHLLVKKQPTIRTYLGKVNPIIIRIINPDTPNFTSLLVV
jgi:hypothetical protein